MVDTVSKRVNIQLTSGIDSRNSEPSCSEAFVISSPTVSVDLQNEPLSPVSERYRLKKFHLQQKYEYIYMSNNRLRNRLYHIKKEINHLKRLKRVLCQRLFTFRDPFMDSCLEIPDNDPTSPTTEKISNDAMGKPSSSSKKKKAAEVKRVNQRSIRKTEVQCFRKPKEDGEVGFVTTEVDTAIFPFAQKSKLQVNEVSSMVEIAKNSVISIIDSVITESHEERVRANQNSTGQKTPRQSPTLPVLGETVRNEAEIGEVSEDGEPVTERMLRASSIDHLLPIDPDSDPNNVLTGFGENLEENFMAED
uniref:Bm10974, isoform a n=2 Tax=Brugia TaxID=6278 RepID=A0A1I9G4V9_BRUMA|nr:Bm10974, isoform a [Brugia malayi]